MSRIIDYTKPLDEEDVRYLRDRGRPIPSDADFTDGGYAEQESASDRNAELEDLRAKLAESEAAKAEAEAALAEATSGATDGEVPDYSEWEYNDLKAEAKHRNLSTDGKKEDLVARLVEDDESDNE